ncbi:sigma-70 family RNA polymerase sigma factor [Streptomyces sp. PTM05]|uniref:Sigma-70 family RNA polymerase sigma factor n=2 Tax=Streptantibioticus parmotrematis TaxID=2873249 RepID=A0ABS7R0F3_9ACTN|nr:sigma-70 family RNA polymerase sigma factor [Streptantibioticus parmotrematis]
MRVLYEVHAASLLRTLLGWTKGDRQAAEDLMQETMLRAWRHLGALHEDPRSVRPWLLTVARRLAIDALRARAARPPEVEDEPLARIPVVAQPMEQVLDRQVLRDAMASLTATHRTVVVEVYIRQQSVREVAERLGIPEGTVKSRSYNALRALRDALGHDPAFESRGPGRAVALRGGRAAGRALTAQRAA